MRAQTWGLAAVLGALAALLVGCPPPASPCERAPFWGDPTQAPELDILERTDEGGYALVEKDGDPVNLKFPVQGGHVLFIGARIRNMDGCRAEIRARVYYPDGGPLFAEERRSIDFPEDGGSGGISVLSDSANVANIPMCPDFEARDVVDQPWMLEVQVKDQIGRIATRARTVVPRCSQPRPYSRAACVCECKANYSFGKCTSVLTDGGP